MMIGDGFKIDLSFLDVEKYFVDIKVLDVSICLMQHHVDLIFFSSWVLEEEHLKGRDMNMNKPTYYYLVHFSTCKNRIIMQHTSSKKY